MKKVERFIYEDRHLLYSLVIFSSKQISFLILPAAHF